MVFPSTSEGFPHKIQCSCVVCVYVVLAGNIFCFHKIAIAW